MRKNDGEVKKGEVMCMEGTRPITPTTPPRPIAFSFTKALRTDQQTDEPTGPLVDMRGC